MAAKGSSADHCATQDATAGWAGRKARLLDLLGREGSSALDDDELGRLLDRFVAREGKGKRRRPSTLSHSFAWPSRG